MQKLATDQVKLEDIPEVPAEKVLAVGRKMALEGISRLDNARISRDRVKESLSEPLQPWKYLIVATGNIYDDCAQAVSAVECGADIIAVIRTTAQSLLDYVPDGISTEDPEERWLRRQISG